MHVQITFTPVRPVMVRGRDDLSRGLTFQVTFSKLYIFLENFIIFSIVLVINHNFQIAFVKMTRFSVTWEGICREENLSPSQIVELLEEETSELRSFQMNSIHSLAIICDELDDDSPKDSSPPDTVSWKVPSELSWPRINLWPVADLIFRQTQTQKQCE